MQVNCFPKAITTWAVVGLEPATAGSRVRRANHCATLQQQQQQQQKQQQQQQHQQQQHQQINQQHQERQH